VLLEISFVAEVSMIMAFFQAFESVSVEEIFNLQYYFVNLRIMD